MVIHLAVHAAVHGFSRPMWIDDLRFWIDANSQIRWDRLLQHLARWQLGWPFAQAMAQAERGHRPLVPSEVHERLLAMRGSWRDRLALRQAPHDANRPIRHVGVNLLCTHGWGFRLAYLWALLTPDQAHMAAWGGADHAGSVRFGWLRRWLAPTAVLIRWLGPRAAHLDVRRSGIHGFGVFATRELRAGQTIASVSKRVVEHDNAYVVHRSVQGGTPVRQEITGKLRWLNHSCRPNAALSGGVLKAVRRIASGEEITIDYGLEACACRRPAAFASLVANSSSSKRPVSC
jgi:hypothetical protein